MVRARDFELTGLGEFAMAALTMADGVRDGQLFGLTLPSFPSAINDDHGDTTGFDWDLDVRDKADAKVLKGTAHAKYDEPVPSGQTPAPGNQLNLDSITYTDL